MVLGALLGGVVLSVGSHPHAYGDTAKPAHEAPGQPSPSHAAALGGLAPANYNQEASDNTEAGSDENLDIARETMKATKKQATWTFATFWVGVAGTIAVVITLIANFRAVGAAERSADTAEQAMRNLERPYLFLHEISAHVMPTGKIPGGKNDDRLEQTYFAYAVRNSGRTPALLQEVFVYAGFLESLPTEPDYTKCTRKTGELVIEDKTTIRQPHHRSKDWITTRLMDDLCIGDKKYVAYGKIIYTDIFGAEYKTGFAYRWDQPNGELTADGGQVYNYHT